jgi:hypothetical protein
MHMKDMWGYRLVSPQFILIANGFIYGNLLIFCLQAEFPNEKSIRATYRASSHLSILHDASYMACLELKGEAEDISRLLAPITDLSLPSVASLRYCKPPPLVHTVIL